MQGQRSRRQSSAPMQSGKFEFLDGYSYGLIHYSGDESDVSHRNHLPLRPKLISDIIPSCIQVIFVLTFNVDRNGDPIATNLYRFVES